LKANELHNSEELTFEQKLWKGTETFLYSIRPLVLYLFLPAMLMTVGSLLFGGRTSDEVVSESGNFYYTLGILLTIYLIYKRSVKRGSSLKEEATLELKDVNRKRIGYLLGMGFGFGFFFSALITVVPFPKVLMESYTSSSEILRSGTDQGLALLSTALFAPVAEEIIFRGYMLNRLLQWFQEKHAVWLVSVVFALCHVSPIWMIYAFLMGVLLARVSIVEDNITYSIALHIGFNVNVVPIWLINRSETLSEVLFANNLLIGAYGVIFGLMAVWFMKKYKRGTEEW